MNQHTAPNRFRADFPPGTVVFLIGMRINRWRSPRSWLPAFGAMPRMLRELSAPPELGFLDATPGDTTTSSQHATPVALLVVQ
jgi:hypothetical protein